jgi:hypothetical protein
MLNLLQNFCNFSGEGWVLEREVGMFNRRTPPPTPAIRGRRDCRAGETNSFLFWRPGIPVPDV